jgi:hypothetical protein
MLMAFLGASALVVASAGPALAECMTWPDRATERLHVGYAFKGTVVGVSKTEDPEQGGSPLYNWRITVDVEDVYRGRVPDQLVLEGTDWGCSFLYVSRLAEGDGILIASERLRPGMTDETDLGNVLAWKRTGNRWVFHEEALQDGSNLEFYPRAARTASTTPDVLRLINGAAMPDTSTAPLDQPRTPTPAPVLALVFAASLGVMLLVGRHSMDGPRRPYRRRPRPERAEPGERSIHRGRIRERH